MEAVGGGAEIGAEEGGVFEDTDVGGDGEGGHAEAGSEVADGVVGVGKEAQDVLPQAGAEGLKGGQSAALGIIGGQVEGVLSQDQTSGNGVNARRILGSIPKTSFR